MGSVSALVVSYNVRDLLLDTMQSVYAQKGVAVDAVVVDNGSADGSVEALRRRFPNTKVIALKENVGFAAANNAGLAHAGGDYILLLNPDVVLEPGCVAALLRFLECHPRAGAAGPRLQRTDGSPDKAARRGFPTPAAAFYRLTGLSRVFPRSARFNRYNLGHLSADDEQEIDAGTAACLLVRRKAIDEVGFFDPAFFMYGEDLDLCFRLKEAGWTIHYVPKARAVHVKGASSRQATGRMLYEFHRAMWIFHERHFAARMPAPANWLVWGSIWARWAALSARARLFRDPRVSP